MGFIPETRNITDAGEKRTEKFERFMYTGKQNDLVTGFYFYGARFYYPAISRFISEDTSSGSITSPLSLNRYSYVEDNPESFNDPSGNVFAYAFGGEAYSIHPVAPVPSPTPPPAPSQPATPPPSTPASPSNPNNGNSVTTQSSASSSGPGYWNWLYSQKALLGQLIATAAGDVASIFDPLAKGIFSIIARTLTSVGSVVSDIESFAQAFLQHDLSGAVSRLSAFGWDLTKAVITDANWYQRILIGAGIAVVGAGDVGSEGSLQYVLATVGIFQLTTDLSLFFSETLSDYNNMYPNG